MHYWAEKGNSKDRSPASNSLKALLARKKQSEGLKSCLEYLKGVASPKGQFEGPKPCLEYLEGAAGPKGQFETISIKKFPRMSKHPLLEEPHSKCSAKDRVVEELCVCLGNTKERSTKASKEIQSKKSSECKGHIPLRLERILTSLYPLSRKESTYPKDRVTADDMLRRVVTSSSAGMA
jgi:hypothetical protein